MNRFYRLLFPGAALMSLGVSVYLMWIHPAPRIATSSSASMGKEVADLKRTVQDLRTQVAELRRTEVALPSSPAAHSSLPSASPAPGKPAGASLPSNSPVALDQRLKSLEASVAFLRSAMDGVSLEKASAERQAQFAAEEGYLKADEYFEAGKYAIAGEGYLTFVQNHPDHADVREIMKKARDAFLKAGYKDKAFWVQEEMNKRFPQFAANDIWEQAQLEKNAGLYHDAVTHAAQAAELAPNVDERLWRRLYWAWYVELRDGTAAGIDAYLQVQKEIAASGASNPKLAQRAQEKLAELYRKRN